MNTVESFNYTYSAPTEEERREIESIKRQYAKGGEAESRLERLHRLHSSVMNFANAVSIAIGVVGTLIFGLGMALAMEWNDIIWGILCGVVGLVIAMLAYPAYKISLAAGKRKWGEEIVKLSDELLGEE